MQALLCATVVNTVSAIFASKDSKHKPISPEAFIPKWADAYSSGTEEAPSEEQSLEDQKRAILSIAKMFDNKPKTKTRSAPPPSKRKGVSKNE
jgi:hypothetical protein